MITSASLYLHLPLSLMTSDTTLSCASNEALSSETSLTSDTSCKTEGPLGTLTFGQLTTELRESALPSGFSLPYKTQKSNLLSVLYRTKILMTDARRGGKGPVGSWPYIHRCALTSGHFDVLSSIEQSMQSLPYFQTHRSLCRHNGLNHQP